ncbi:MAG: glycosyltransferase family 2 protein [Gammaproteobacteria bacterium]|jgi:glycosyltransferase involved in cell wall biosynthesis
MKLSVVIPVMNEEDNIQPLIEQVDAALTDIDYELILVDDGSSDKTIEKIKAYALDNTKLLVFSRNYGQTTAMAAGIEEASGELIVTLDGDLQNDPADIPMMIRKLEEDACDVVAGIRARRQDGLILRKIPSKVANWLIRKTTGVHISDYGCTLKLFKTDVAKNLGLYGELHRFIPVLAELYGAKMVEMEVKHHPRVHGVSKYGIGRTFKVFSDLLLMLFFQKYNTRPMHLFGTLGGISFGIGALINFYLLILKLLGEDIGSRPLLTLGITLSLIGVQLITTGFIAEILMRTYYESQNKKPYVIKEKIIGKS